MLAGPLVGFWSFVVYKYNTQMVGDTSGLHNNRRSNSKSAEIVTQLFLESHSSKLFTAASTNHDLADQHPYRQKRREQILYIGQFHLNCTILITSFELHSCISDMKMIPDSSYL